MVKLQHIFKLIRENIINSENSITQVTSLIEHILFCLKTQTPPIVCSIFLQDTKAH